jgi:hypothetical protein
MKRDSLPKELRKKLDGLKIPTLRELDDTLKCLAPEQLKFLENHILDVDAKFRRSLFRLIPGRRRS